MAKVSVIGICGRSVFMEVDHFHEEGETVRAHSLFEEMGGKGINQAIAARRMGAEVSFLAAFGDDDAAVASRLVAEENGLKFFPCIKKGKSSPLAFILTDKNGENRVTVYGNATLSPQDVIDFEDEIKTSDVLLLQHEVPEEANEEAIKIASRHGVKVVLNPAPPRPVSNHTLKATYAVVPNEQESKYIDKSLSQNTIITLGKKGCKINDTLHIPALPAKAVDTTGAGDTFCGVLAACIAGGKDLEYACRMGVVASGISVSRKHVLDAIPYKDEIERKMRNE